MSKQYYVYYVYLGDEIVYIGKGSGNRYLHPLSGASHNSRLNECWFRHILLGAIAPTVKIQTYFNTEHEALSNESMLIEEYSPPYNKRRDITQAPLPIEDFLSWAITKDGCRAILHSKKYNCTLKEDKDKIDMVLQTLSDGRKGNGGHNKKEFNEKHGLGAEESKFINNLVGKLVKSGDSFDEEYLLMRLDYKRKGKRWVKAKS